MDWTKCIPLPTPTDIKQYRDHLFKNVKPVRPTAIVMVGGPGSGKSLAQQDCVNKLKMNMDDFVILDKDDIYKNLFNMNNHCYYVPSDKIGIEFVNDENITYASENGYNVIIDSTGKDYSKTYQESIMRFKNKGYRVVICITLLDIAIGLQRVEKRRLQTGRGVTKEYLEKTYKTMSDVIPKYFNLSDKEVDAIFVYDNESDLGLMFEKFRNEFICLNRERVKKYFPDHFNFICK